MVGGGTQSLSTLPETRSQSPQNDVASEEVHGYGCDRRGVEVDVAADDAYQVYLRKDTALLVAMRAAKPNPQISDVHFLLYKYVALYNEEYGMVRHGNIHSCIRNYQIYYIHLAPFNSLITKQSMHWAKKNVPAEIYRVYAL